MALLVFAVGSAIMRRASEGPVHYSISLHLDNAQDSCWTAYYQQCLNSDQASGRPKRISALQAHAPEPLPPSYQPPPGSGASLASCVCCLDCPSHPLTTSVDQQTQADPLPSQTGWPFLLEGCSSGRIVEWR